MTVPRPEYPRPQFVRDRWLCLNGEWQFEIDHGDSGGERGLITGELAQRITVPFCPESELSGIGHVDFMDAVWYRRQVTVPDDWDAGQVLLHFQAVDHDATVWIDGEEVYRHRGGWTPFTIELGERAQPGRTLTITVRARDYKFGHYARGKQSRAYHNHSCFYTRTTGIWQTVWLEPVPRSYLRRPRLTPDVANRTIRLTAPIAWPSGELRLRATLSDDQGEVVTRDCVVRDFSPTLDLEVPADRVKLWGPGEPHLYDLKIELLDGETVIDRLDSYAALRSVRLDGRRVLINDKPVFQRLVLDQGYYPDGILTAPSDEALVRDIELSLEAGFNGARLHQKVFEERFLYHADRLGYLCWGEFGDWGTHGLGSHAEPLSMQATFITQWLEAVERDYSHPSIIGWCPQNESGQQFTDQIQDLDDIQRGMYLAAKAMDTTRPVLDSSGWAHRVYESDIYDAHDYEQDPGKLAERHARLEVGREPEGVRHFTEQVRRNLPYNGQPYFVSEFGGIKWNPQTGTTADRRTSWGYGRAPETLAEFYERFAGQCAALMDQPEMFGYCYTQLTDVFQEQNGVYAFDRSRKFDIEPIRKAQQRPAAME
jgi:beta-galactosidase/beta-glucuronidase